jgi:hypothetical protein
MIKTTMDNGKRVAVPESKVTYRMKVLVGVSVHEQLVKVIGDTATVLDDTDHVTHSLPRGAPSLLCLHIQQVVLQEKRSSVVKNCESGTAELKTPVFSKLTFMPGHNTRMAL